MHKCVLTLALEFCIYYHGDQQLTKAMPGRVVAAAAGQYKDEVHDALDLLTAMVRRTLEFHKQSVEAVALTGMI